VAVAVPLASAQGGLASLKRYHVVALQVASHGF
jgi:hypothetical protein